MRPVFRSLFDLLRLPMLMLASLPAKLAERFRVFCSSTKLCIVLSCAALASQTPQKIHRRSRVQQRGGEARYLRFLHHQPLVLPVDVAVRRQRAAPQFFDRVRQPRLEILRAGQRRPGPRGRAWNPAALARRLVAHHAPQTGCTRPLRVRQPRREHQRCTEVLVRRRAATVPDTSAEELARSVRQRGLAQVRKRDDDPPTVSGLERNSQLCEYVLVILML